MLCLAVTEPDCEFNFMCWCISKDVLRLEQSCWAGCALELCNVVVPNKRGLSFFGQRKNRWKEWFLNLEIDSRNEEISKVDISEQWQASRKISNFWKYFAFLLATDDLGIQQAHGFDHQDPRCRGGEPCGRLTLSSQGITWKFVLRN